MKLLIIGIVASGKTTLARKLSIKYNIPYFEIDQIVHDDINNLKRNNKEQMDIINGIDKNNKDWIIEGTLRRNMDYLLNLANKIVYIDIPVKIRRKRIVTRYIKQKLGIEKSNYKPSLKMLKMMFKWTNDYERNKEDMDYRLKNYIDKTTILNSVEKINNYTLIP